MSRYFSCNQESPAVVTVINLFLAPLSVQSLINKVSNGYHSGWPELLNAIINILASNSHGRSYILLGI